MLRKYTKTIDINSIPHYNGFDFEDTFFFDIESTGLSSRYNRIYMIGVIYLSEDQKTLKLVQLMTECPDDEPELIRRFAAFTKHFTRCVTYNGKAFDMPFIKKRADMLQLNLKFNELSHYDLYLEIKSFSNMLPLNGMKQKDLENFLGIYREDKYNGGELIAVYERYEKTKNDDDYVLLSLHNAEDIEGMLSVVSILMYKKILHGRFDVDSVELLSTDGTSTNSVPGVPSPELTERSYILVTTTLKKPVPINISHRNDYLHTKIDGDKMNVMIPLISDTKKLFFDDYKNYYYLPMEEKAVHKSVGRFVDRRFRQQAKASNCFESFYGNYIPAPNLNLLKKIRSLPVTLVRGVSELKLFYDEYKSKETYLKYPFISLPEGLDDSQVMKAYIVSYLSK